MDINHLQELYEKANLSELTSCHIISKGYEHLANLVTAPDKPCFVIMHRKEIMDWFAAIHNAAPEIFNLLRSQIDDGK